MSSLTTSSMAPAPVPPVPVFYHAPLPKDSTHGCDLDDTDFQLLSEYLMDDSERSNITHPSPNSDQVYGPTFPTIDHLGTADPAMKRKIENGKSQNQFDRRKERNRVLARKTRQRKKFFFQSLQHQVAKLTRENRLLKQLVRERVSSFEAILQDCNTEIPSIVSAYAENATSLLDNSDYKLMKAIQAAQRSFCVTDPKLPDNPIVFAAQGFLELTKYKIDQVIGRNCRFLQGPDTDIRTVQMLRAGIAAGIDTSVCMKNYKADGTAFYNQVFVAALRDHTHRIVNYVGVQVEVAKPADDDDKYMEHVLEAAATTLVHQHAREELKTDLLQPAKFERTATVSVQDAFHSLGGGYPCDHSTVPVMQQNKVPPYLINPNVEDQASKA